MTHESNVVLAQFSPDGRRVVTASSDRTARVWDAATGKPVGELLTQVRSAWFSPDGQRVLTTSWNWIARVWDVATGKPVGSKPRGGPEWDRRYSFVALKEIAGGGERRSRSVSWDAEFMRATLISVQNLKRGDRALVPSSRCLALKELLHADLRARISTHPSIMVERDEPASVEERETAPR
jgi:WD40 repeat protein